MDGHQGMPVVGGGNLDGINVLAFEHALILLIHVATLRHALLLLPCCDIAAEALALDAVHITAGGHLHTRTTAEGAEVATALLAQSHKAKYHTVGGCNAHAIDGETGQNHKSGQPRGGCPQELTSAHAIGTLCGARSFRFFLVYCFHFE